SRAARLRDARRLRPPSRSLSCPPRGRDVGRLRTGRLGGGGRRGAGRARLASFRAARPRPPARIARGHRRAALQPADLAARGDAGARLLPVRPSDPGAGAPPGIAALELAITRREATADYLTQWQIAYDEMPDGRLAIPANEANGTVLFLTDAR